MLITLAMSRINTGPPCQVCNAPSVARNLCETHYSRWKRHGHAEQTRPGDWGMRNSHPLWEIWKNTKRVAAGRCPEWDDFWEFVSDVGERPSPKHCLARSNNKQAYGPTNVFWREPVLADKLARDAHAEYQREWRRKNSNRARSYDVKRKYGISIADYDRMMDEQNGACAICGGTDTTFGRLAIDHCHDTKKVRGLLCNVCNRSLGGFRDSTEILMNAIKYLTNSS